MSIQLHSVSGRAKLEPRREPHWQNLGSGRALGFRRMSADALGTWVARVVDTSGRRRFEALGDLAELAPSKQFDEAKRLAEAWFAHVAKGGSAKGATVAQICASYVESKRVKGETTSADDIERRFKQYVTDDPAFAARDVRELTPQILGAWLSRLAERPSTAGINKGKRRSVQTLNRDVTPFRAALNQALADGIATTDFAWRQKLKVIATPTVSRDLYLTVAQRRKLIDRAAPDFANLLRCLCLLPSRPGALAALTVGSWDGRTGTLRIGVDKGHDSRPVRVPEELAALIIKLTEGRPKAEPLFRRDNGSAWDRFAWREAMKETLVFAKINEPATLYTIRHSTITDLVTKGADLMTVAEVAGTSVRMIEKHYKKLIPGVTERVLSLLTL